MVTTGLLLGVVTAAGFMFIWVKLPKTLRNFLTKYSLLTDLVVCVATYVLLGGTITALFASAFMGIIVSMMLALVNNEQTGAMLERFVVKISMMKEIFLKGVQEFAERNLPPVPPKDVAPQPAQ